MAYPDFTTAFNDWASFYHTLTASWANAVYNWNDAYYFYEPTTDFENSLALAVNDLIDCVNLTDLVASGPNYMDSAHYASVYWAGQGAVTLQGMIDALLDGQYSEYVDWLGIMWAIQQILWDQPFFPEKYQDLVNRIRT